DSSKFSKYKRASANALLKSQLLDDGLADVTFYMSDSGGSRIGQAVQDALLRSLSVEKMSLDGLSIGRQPTARDAPLFIISESLGSKIVIDSLNQFENDASTRSFAQKARGNIHTLFLLANQLPILNLGLQDDSGQPDSYTHLLDFAKARNAHRNKRLP